MDYSTPAPTGTETTPVTAMPSILTATDRCDASYSEQATTVYVRPNGETLMFCNHHSAQYDSKLRLMGYEPL